MIEREYISLNADETIAYGRRFGQALPANSVVCLFGDLGAGKTTFVKGLVSSFDEHLAESVHSPTFVYLNIYEGSRTVYHFDLYRISQKDEFLRMGFDEFLFAGGICCIEWSERIQELLPADCRKIVFTHLAENKRKIELLS